MPIYIGDRALWSYFHDVERCLGCILAQLGWTTILKPGGDNLKFWHLLGERMKSQWGLSLDAKAFDILLPAGLGQNILRQLGSVIRRSVPHEERRLFDGMLDALIGSFNDAHLGRRR